MLQTYNILDYVKKISIFEPNMSIMKWALPSVLICENVERTISEKELIKHVYITNINSYTCFIIMYGLFRYDIKNDDFF